MLSTQVTWLSCQNFTMYWVNFRILNHPWTVNSVHKNLSIPSSLAKIICCGSEKDKPRCYIKWRRPERVGSVTPRMVCVRMRKCLYCVCVFVCDWKLETVNRLIWYYDRKLKLHFWTWNPRQGVCTSPHPFFIFIPRKNKNTAENGRTPPPWKSKN